jgi:hypothetical protein
MRKLLLPCFFFLGMILTAAGQVTVTVTNPTNTTPNLAASYTSLANAITGINSITAMSGPVVLTCAAGSETAPVGGYNIGSIPTSATNTITITAAGTVTLTAFTPQSSGIINDAVLKLTGSDYFTISGLTIKENASNTTTSAGTNNMTEFGIALLRNSTTDGAQHNTIQNNIISLNKTYTNTFGIYSNCRHAAATVTSTSEITNITGSNFGNKVYGNNISNVNYGIWFNGSAVAAYMDDGNDIGGSSVATGNTITNWGQDVTSVSYIDGTINVCGILTGHQVNENISYNTVTSASWSGSSSINAIYKFYPAGQPSGTFSSTISYNNVTITSSSSPATIIIQNSGISPALSTATVNITNNTIQNCAINSTGSTLTGIYNTSIVGSLNINSNIFKGNTSAATSGGFIGIQNNAAVTNTININSNQVGISGNGAVGFSGATSSSIVGISCQNAGSSCLVNINSNSIDGITLVTCGVFQGISNASPAATINMNNNQLGSVSGNFVTFSGAQSGNVSALNNNGGSSSSTLTIQGNDIKGIINSVAATCTYELIGSASALLSQTVSGNTFTNLTLNTTGNVYFIRRQSTMSSGATWNCNNNSIVTGFTLPNTVNTFSFIYTSSTSGTGVTMSESNNNFSNVTIAGASFFFGIYDLDGFGAGNIPVKTVNGNTFNNINTGASSAIMIWCNNVDASSSISSNTISNISGSGNLWMIQHNSNYGSGLFTIANNNISTVSSSAGSVYGIYAATTVSSPVNISGNTIAGLSGANTFATGIYISDAALINIYDNNINNIINSSSTASSSANGIMLGNLFGTITTVNVYNNKIHTISETGNISSGSTTVNGIIINYGSNVTIYNNFIANLLAPNVSLTDAIRGINIATFFGSNTTYNLYYNSIYINASTAGTNFGSTGIYHNDNATSTTVRLTMNDNIIVNTSTPKGTGSTIAFWNSGTTLGNYNTSSDNNLFYAGTPAANRLIYYDGVNSDQALATFQARVSPREANSISLMPAFTSSTDLHLTSTDCLLDNQGAPVSGITTDIDGATRDVTTPDIGADEFSASLNTTLAGINGSAVCAYKTVSASGTTYSSNSCDLIAKITSSGANPVAGKINACVTLDATQQFFNAEPFVQRHYDIEPLTSNTTTTSATVTLYFTDAEFLNFNTNNPAWPKLPTAAGGGSADPNRANLKVTQYHGTPTTTPSTPGNYTANAGSGTYINPNDANITWNGFYWSVTFDITGFSGFYVHTNLYYPLSVSINYFKGTRRGNDHLLSWKVTCNSTPKVTMVLERSAEANGNFYPVSTITADAVRCAQPFDYTDAAPLKGMNYYRLKLTDSDGKISYSSTIALLNAATGSVLISVVPNPVTADGSFKLNMTSAQEGKMELIISDIQGRIVKRKTCYYVAGYKSIDMNVGNLAPGIYYIRANGANTEHNMIRFVKQ